MSVSVAKTIEEYMATVDATTTPSKSNDHLDGLIKDLVSNNVKLDVLIQSLEPFMVSVDLQKRLKSIKFISKLIVSLPTDYLTPLEIDHISKFLCSKLDDHYTIAPAVLPSLEYLLKLNKISKDKQLDIIKSLLTGGGVHVQSLVQSDRYIVYSICYFMLVNRVDLIHKYKYDNDFLYGFIQSMDGEKDPRNLVICFDVITLICRNINVSTFVEELFEVFSCYFPIDFNPPTDDRNGITKDALIHKLRSCFASTPLFAKYSIPLLLDKLESDVDSARLDALLTYIECSQVYDVTDYKDYIEALWNNFQKMAMSTTSQLIENASLKAIESLTGSISRCVQKEGTLLSIETFVEKCVQCCLVYLKELDLKLVWPSAKCLQSISSATSTSNLLILKIIIKFLIDLYNTHTNNQQKRTCLDILWQFILISRKFSATQAPKYLVESKNELLDVCFIGINQNIHKSQSINGFFNLVIYKNLYDLTHYEQILKLLFKQLIVESDKSELINENQLIQSLLLVLNQHESLFELLFAELEQLKLTNKHKSFEIMKLLLDNYKQIDVSTTIVDKLNENVCTRLHEYLVSCVENREIAETNEFKLCFDSLKLIIQSNNGDYSETSNDFKYKNLFIFILKQFLTIDLYRTNDICSFISNLFQVFSFKLKSKSVYEQIMTILNDAICSFELDTPLTKLYLVQIYMQFVCSLDNKLFENELIDTYKKLNEKLFDLATKHTNETIHLLCCQFYASLVNKLCNDAFVENLLVNSKLLENLSKQIEFNEDKSIINRDLVLWAWLTKALLIRGHKLYEYLTDKLIEWLDNENLSELSAKLFIILLNLDDFNIMTKTKNNANVKLFYQQRFFNYICVKLKEKFDKSTVNKFKAAYVTALTSTLSFLPSQLIKQNFKTMLPMLVYSLSNCDNENLWLCTLKSLNDLIDNDLINGASSNKDENLLIDYLADILTRLYVLSRYTGNMEIRLLSLNCLFKLCELNPNQIIKYQRDVVRNIEPCLGDKKRLVRQRAVAVRNRWYLLSTKSE